ncbi:uncharacterized protein J4E84_009253 [Alternaria hordeiaustralica]|uniref:uncharacterized protein n=1 Tax=Alternaria hordeiaustralica TaxID=1187925 RepID=UPI0020C4C072|nr:uncharacterized protein J4E84_009253 [Alternaria hordeiaustralica]KAI4676953.1 hypothetical protein J4E84_009253 [Alternaria hordeiaustralica]
MSPPPAASPPFSHAASLAHYETKNSFELMVMAKLRCISDAGENQEIIARLMAQDRENGTWPGKYEGPGAAAMKTDIVAAEKKGEDGEEVVMAPVERILVKEERTPEAGVGGEGRADHVPVAIVSGDRRGRAATANTAATSTRSRSPIIPLSQLAKEWDQDWGAPFAFPLAATTGSKPQAKAKPVTPTESVSSGSKSPVTPASPRSQTSRVSLATPASSPPTIPASLKSNPYNLLMSDEQDDDEDEDEEEEEEEEEEESENEGLIIPLKMYTEKARAAAESTGAEITYAATSSSKDAVAAPTEQTENLPAPDSLASFEPSEVMSAPGGDVMTEAPVVVRDFGAMVSNSPSSSRSLKEAAHKSDVAAFYNMPPLSPVQPATSTKNTPVQVFVSAPPSPPSSPPQHTHTVPSSSAPTKKTHQRRKPDKVTAPSNMYDVLITDDPVDADDTASALVDTDDERDGDSDVKTAPVPGAQKKKNRRRGKKGGKKVQAMKQKVEQAVEVPVVVAPVLQQTVAMSVKVGKKMELSQALGVAAIVMVLVALLGARVLG